MTSNVGVKIVRVRKCRRWRLSPRSVLLIFASLLMFGFAWAVLGLGLITLLVLLLASLTVLMVVRPHRVRPSWAASQLPAAVRNPEQLSFRLGSAILLITALIALGYSVPEEKYREWAALAETPKPSGCNWTSLPLGEKHCHYEPIFHHVNEPGEHITVTWRRVDGDY